MSELVSIIVPVYRVEQYLHKCVDSILRQTYSNLEIILVDDGSDDNCPAICDEYEKKDDRIVVIHKKNGGLSDARNIGLEKAKGNLITFVDSDDTIEPNYVKQLVQTMAKYGADISICGHTAIYGDKRVEYCSDKDYLLTSKEALEKILYHEDFNSSSWAKLYKKAVFKGIRFPVGENYEDTSTTYKLLMNSRTIGCNLRSQYNYIIRSNSIMTHAFSEKDMLLIKSWEIMTNEIIKKYPDLKKGAIRGRTYSKLCTFRKVMMNKESLKKYGRALRNDILESKAILLKDKKCPKRDKIAVILLQFGVTPFRLGWGLYCVITGRNI